ncbi:MAG: hypothetical protein EXR05_06415 [Acetobacteraceae bacterium]|nr:hypothetical protein [Acetobacteraceae bacterium]MSP30819.1 hypothetical protein [Acetobacteraceae bacterium]
MVALTWTEEPKPSDENYLAALPQGISESLVLGDMLTRIGRTTRQLEPADAMHRQLTADCSLQFNHLARARWHLIEAAGGLISVPIAAGLMFWIAIVFASFGLNAPRDVLSSRDDCACRDIYCFRHLSDFRPGFPVYRGH